MEESLPEGMVEELNDVMYVPRGSTALLDAIGRTINSVGARLTGIEKKRRPYKVSVAILTDGEENSSQEMTLNKITEMINHQRDKYNWEFIFLAANQDAIQSGAAFGIHAKDAFNFTADAIGTQTAYKSMSRTVAGYRGSDITSSGGFDVKIEN